MTPIPKAFCTPKPLSASERIEMIRGPQVDIYVGPAKSHFKLPKLLLAHYSAYFDRCFNGDFIEGQKQVLVLEEDDVKFFEALVDYMLTGKPASTIEIASQDLPIRQGITHQFNEYMSFVRYADFFGLGGASEAILEPLKKLLVLHKQDRCKLSLAAQVFYHDSRLIEAEHIELVFRVVPEGSPLRTLIVQGVLSEYGLKGCESLKELEKKVDGLAAEMLDQIRKAAFEWTDKFPDWLDPLDNKVVK